MFKFTVNQINSPSQLTFLKSLYKNKSYKYNENAFLPKISDIVKKGKEDLIKKGLYEFYHTQESSLSIDFTQKLSDVIIDIQNEYLISSPHILEILEHLDTEGEHQ